MWSDAARQASLLQRRNGAGGEVAPAAPASTGAPAAHQTATFAVPANFIESEKAAASAQMANLAHSGTGSVDRSPPTNYRAPQIAPVNDVARVMRDYSERANGGERQNTYNAPRYSDMSQPTRQIADYSNKNADQGQSAGVIDRLKATYGG